MSLPKSSVDTGFSVRQAWALTSLLSLSVITAAYHESCGEDITSVIVQSASHLALLLASCLDNGSLGS
jgi:hypothetical protein